MTATWAEWAMRLFSVAAGAILGAFYFGGLWWTVTRLPRSRAPALLNLGSLVLRIAVVLAGFFLLMGGRWERLLLALAGLIAARQVIFALVGRKIPASRGGAGKSGPGNKGKS